MLAQQRFHGATFSQVTILLPDTSPVRPLSSARLLRLELWHSHHLLSHCSVLLLPSSMPDTSAELQSLPWGPGSGGGDVAAFVLDLGHWLQHHDPMASPLAVGHPVDAYINAHSAEVARAAAAAAYRAEASAAAWRVGRGLLRQAALWGMPSLATLLLECLMALPSAPPAAFTQLMQAPLTSFSRSSSGGGSAAEHTGGGEGSSQVASEGLGSLMHLSLLSPRPMAMLPAALGWARRWGIADSHASPGFAWRWGQPNAQVRGAWHAGWSNNRGPPWGLCFCTYFPGMCP